MKTTVRNTVKIIALSCIFFSLTSSYAQAPQKMSYQAVLRNAGNALVSNAPVAIRVSVLQGSATGTAVYVERQTLTTNVNGLATFEIGSGTIISGTFSGINWASGVYFVKTETDPAGGTNYTISGTSQLLSVPYALYAKTADGISATNITNWNSAYAWGNHAGLYRPITYVPNWSEVANKPTFGQVATSGNYNDLTNKPAIDGSETKVTAGTNVTVTGAGTIASPYVVNSTGTTGTPSTQWATTGNNISNTNTGNVGIGVSDPSRPLSFPATLEKKISLYPGGTGDAGFGVFGNELRINSDHASADITMGFDNYINGFTERMRVKGNGNVGIGTNNPTYKLDLAGRMRVRSDGNTAGIYFNNLFNDQVRGFIGMVDNDLFGLYGDAGAGWALTMSTSTGAVQVNNRINISGFTTLGEQAPAIKTKLITGTTSPIPLGFADIAHGLNRSKIVGISILVTTIDGVDVGPGYFVTTGLLYNFQINANSVRITNPLLPIDCGLILFRPVRILITYQE